MNDDGDERERARAIRERAESDPTAVDAADVISLLVDGDRAGRPDAVAAYDAVAGARPDAAADAADSLEAFLADESATRRRRAAMAVAVLAERTPDELSSLVPALRVLADDPAEPAREPAVLALSALALERPARVASASDALVAICRSPVLEPATREAGGPGDGWTAPENAGNRDRERRDAVRARAMAGLTRIADERPDALAERVSEIGACLEDDHHLLRAGACEALESLSAAHPEAVADFAPALAARVEGDAMHPVPWRAADALNALGEAFPERVGEAVAAVAPAFERLLEARDPGIRGVGVGLLTYAAEAEPAAVERFVPTLRERLSDEGAPVAANAALALGLLGATAARGDLEALAEATEDETVRAMVERALERLDGEAAGSNRGTAR